MFKSHINASSRRTPGSESFSLGFAHQLAIGRPLSAPRTLLAGDFKSIPLRALFEGWWLSTTTCLHQRLEPGAQRAPGPTIAGASPALTVSVAQGGGETGDNPGPAVPTSSVSRDTSATVARGSRCGTSAMTWISPCGSSTWTRSMGCVGLRPGRCARCGTRRPSASHRTRSTCSSSIRARTGISDGCATSTPVPRGRRKQTFGHVLVPRRQSATDHRDVRSSPRSAPRQPIRTHLETPKPIERLLIGNIASWSAVSTRSAPRSERCGCHPHTVTRLGYPNRTTGQRI